MADDADPYRLDEDNPELTREQLAAMRPAEEVLPRNLYTSLVEAKASRRPGAREAVVLDFDDDVLDRLRSLGDQRR